jgi:hypothetical protein
MLKFKETSSGATAFSGASERSLLIDSIVLYVDGSSGDKTITDFSGAVFLDSQQNDNYIVIEFNDVSDAAYTATKIQLLSSSTIIAESEALSIVKTSSKFVKLRISGPFVSSDGSGTPTGNAYKCRFNSTISGVPYATSLREGLVRFARATDSSEPSKGLAVYTASQVDKIVEDAITSGIDLTGYVKWDVESSSPVPGKATFERITVVDSIASPSDTSVITANSSGLSINTPIFVTDSSTPAISSGAITDTTRVINGTYIAALYSNSVDTASPETYGHKLVTSHGVREYVESIDSTAVHKTGAETISGAKTFTGGIVANSTISGTGVQSSTSDWNNSANNSKLPTVQVVSSAISAIDTAYKAADSGLQAQIDGINAGQNLADIVADRTALGNLAITDLKAKNDYKHGSSGDTWASGDKVQILEDDVAVSGSTVSTVYELVKGTKGASPDLDAKTTGYYWDYIGPYGSESYSKSESDSRYVQIENLVDSSGIVSGATTDVPSADAVYDYITGLDLSGTYATLSGDNTFTGDNTFSGSISCDEISGKFIVSGTAYSFNTAGSLSYITSTSLTGAADTNVATSLAVKTYVDEKDSAAVHLTGAETISGAKTFSGANTFSGNNTFSGTNTFGSITATSISGDGVAASDMSSSTTQIPTATAVKNYVENAQTSTVSTVNAVGAMGLFMYTKVGDQQLYGDTINGAYLVPVGLSIPYSGEIAYKAVANVTSLSGTWKLLSVAFKRTTQSPCLVLAVKVSNSTPS